MNYMGYNPYDNLGPDEYYTFCEEQGLKPYSSEAHYAWVNECMSEEYADSYGPSVYPEDYAPVYGPHMPTFKEKQERYEKEGGDLPF